MAENPRGGAPKGGSVPPAKKLPPKKLEKVESSEGGKRDAPLPHPTVPGAKDLIKEKKRMGAGPLRRRPLETPIIRKGKSRRLEHRKQRSLPAPKGSKAAGSEGQQSPSAWSLGERGEKPPLVCSRRAEAGSCSAQRKKGKVQRSRNVGW